MSKKYPGFYLYFDWLKMLEQLPRDVGMQIVINVGHFAEDDIEPEPLEDVNYNIIQNFLLDQERRSKKQAERGRKGGTARARNAARNTAREAYLPSPDGGYGLRNDGLRGDGLRNDGRGAYGYDEYDDDEYGGDEYDDPALTEVFERFGVPFRKHPAPDAIE